MKDINKIKPSLRKWTQTRYKKVILALSLVLGVSSLSNAQVNAYSFVQTSGTYTPLSAGATKLAEATGVSGAASLDSVIYPVTGLPFSFYFNGAPYTSLNVSSNGFITFGATAPSTTLYVPISNTATYEGAIAAWARDINAVYMAGGVAGNISYEVVGTTPNREIVIQWTDFKPAYNGAATSVYSFSFQIRLRETTNTIAVVYKDGSVLAGTGAYNNTIQIGLRGATNADFNSRTNDTSTAFTASTAAAVNTASQAFNTTVATPGMPTNGLTYTWTPPTCLPPFGVNASGITQTSATISWGSPATAPANGYDVYYSTSNTAPTASTTLDATNSVTAAASATSAQINGLTSATTYYAWVRAKCSGSDLSNWSTAIVFTTECQPPALTGTTGATVCVNGMATLSATAATGININWYDDATGGNQVGTGTSFTTPALTTTTNYWATATTGTNVNAGKQTYSPSPTSGSGVNNYGLVFDVLAPLTISSVTIYPISSSGASGTVTIDVIDGTTGAVLRTKTINVTGSPTSVPVAQVVNLDFQMTPGTNYRMRPGFTGISGLLFDYASSGNQGYPYTVPGVLSIHTSTYSVPPTTTPYNNIYYYFYDWKVKTGCESPRTQVTATVDQSCMGISETDLAKSVKVYPNPFKDILNVSDVDKVRSITVMDVSGRVVKTIEKVSSSLNLSDLKEGLYLVNLNYKDGKSTSVKVIKK